jgi:hypothetical protein
MTARSGRIVIIIDRRPSVSWSGDPTTCRREHAPAFSRLARSSGRQIRCHREVGWYAPPDVRLRDA